MKKTRLQKAVDRALKAAALPLLIFVLFFIITRFVVSNSNSSFGSIDHIIIILKQACPTLLMAMGMSLNMFAGRWDFSYGSMAVLTSIIAGNLANMWGMGAVPMLLICIIFNSLLGAINGLIYISIKLPALVVSLGMVQIYEMFTAIIFGGTGATVRGDVTNLAVVPTIIIVESIAFAFYYIVINKTRMGYDIRSIGGGQEIARNIGINVRKNAFLCYVVGGVFIGMSAYMTICSNGTQRATLNLESASVMFDAMMCVIIGGYVKRYCNVAVSVFIGVISMKLLVSGLLMLGVPSQMQNIIKGLFLLCFVAFSKNQYKIQERKALRAQADAANERFAAQKAG